MASHPIGWTENRSYARQPVQCYRDTVSSKLSVPPSSTFVSVRLFLVCLCALAPLRISGIARAAGSDDPRLVLMGALKDELLRSQKKLALPREPGPYFIRYLLRDYNERDLSARFGALIENDRQTARHAAVEVRVGDYQFDNTADDSGDMGVHMRVDAPGDAQWHGGHRHLFRVEAAGVAPHLEGRRTGQRRAFATGS